MGWSTQQRRARRDRAVAGRRERRLEHAGVPAHAGAGAGDGVRPRRPHGRRDCSTARVIHLERAVALDSRSDLARANLARVYEWTGRDDDAAAQAQIVRLSTYHVAPVLVAGEVYEDLGRDDGRDQHVRAGDLDGRRAGELDVLAGDGVPARALDEILKASVIGINPCTYGAYLVEGHRFDPQSSLDGAGRARRRAASTCLFAGGSNDLSLRVNMARILMQQGDMAGGVRPPGLRREPPAGLRPGAHGAGALVPGAGRSRRRRATSGSSARSSTSWSRRSCWAIRTPRARCRRRCATGCEELLKTQGSSIQNDIVSVLYYRMRYGRLSPVFALIPGDWSTAVPRPYAAAQAALARWDAARGALTPASGPREPLLLASTYCEADVDGSRFKLDATYR